MTHTLDSDEFFIQRVQLHCAERGLSFFLVEPIWVELFYEKMRAGHIGARVVLNMHSEHHDPSDIYHRLIRLAFQRGAKVIDSPEVALAAFDKAAMHQRLAAAGFRLPATILVDRERIATLALSAADIEALGTPFVIKPSMGYGKRGVILDATNARDVMRSAAAWPDRCYLLQERITPELLDGWPAYFRLFYVFGSVWFCWWNCFTDQYRRMLPDEMDRFGLEPLREVICRLAAISKMQFFSTEVARTEAGEFVLIDYVNDQCHMLTQSANPAIGVPDEIVAAIARRLVEGTQQLLAC